MSHRAAVLGAVTAVLVLVAALILWPTLYRYDSITLRGDTFPVRVNRITGRTYILYPAQWSFAEDDGVGPVRANVGSTPTAFSVKENLDGRAYIAPLGADHALFWQIYNGSERQLTSVTVRLSVLSADGSPVTVRDYRLTGSPFDQQTGFAPEAITSYRTELGLTINENQRWTWSIVGSG